LTVAAIYFVDQPSHFVDNSGLGRTAVRPGSEIAASGQKCSQNPDAAMTGDDRDISQALRFR
jgi:hypothetical protein